MPKLKKEIFLRPNRMTHRFGDKGDQLGGSEYFDLKGPALPKSGNAPSQSASIQKNGQHCYYDPLSPVDKFSGGRASLNGPAPDLAKDQAFPVPASTRKRGPKGVI